MKGKDLIEKLGKGFRKGVYYTLIAGASYLTGCKKDEDPKPILNLSQTAEIVNYVDINYNAILGNVNEATRQTLHNGNLINTKTINTKNYSETLEDLAKGNYTFELQSDNLTNTIDKEVPNYLPEPDYSKLIFLETNIEKNSEINLNLEGIFYDKNPEDNPVSITSAKSLDEKTDVSLDGYNLNIKSKEGIFGAYNVEVEFGTNEGGLSKKVLRGNLLGQDKIAFLGIDRSNPDKWESNIYTMNIDGSELERLTESIYDDLYPSWSPDGKEIAFVTNRSDVDGDGIRDFSIYTMNADGSNKRVLTEGIEYAYHPSWSPNGDRIAFRYREGDLAGIAIINSDGTGYERLVEEPDSGKIPGSPTWSPDASKIAFMTHRDGNWEIYTMNSDGTNQKNITNNSEWDQQPVWSPDGSKILFISNRATGEFSFDLYTMNPNGTNINQLTDNLGHEVDPAWSPDGTKIAFTHDLTSFFNPRVYVMDADGTNWKEFVSGISRYPDFKPN